ncbi:uncharacterized protein [Nicotiana tomentosiformis]|uniref:uncharacterized protein n=1 Tax=Nicotiana tomentosiformis TaxID=4098 RepID=UPI00051BD1DB|nr:uncharacterized protein LOC104119681 [Nicotiana tomentosiformis]
MAEKAKGIGRRLSPLELDEMWSWLSIMKAEYIARLSVKNKLGFINGECKRPDPHSSTFRQWERCDDMVTSWILNSLSKDIADSVEYANDIVELWIELEDRYEQTNGARLYQIQKEINDASQGTLDITSYYTKLKRLWEELSTLSKRS